jgi:hypothetical protein
MSIAKGRNLTDWQPLELTPLPRWWVGQEPGSEELLKVAFARVYPGTMEMETQIPSTVRVWTTGARTRPAHRGAREGKR